MDGNLATLLGLVVTSLTTIAITIINGRKSSRIEANSNRIEQKVDAGNVATDVVHTIVNGEKTRLIAQLAAANLEIQRLATLLPPPDKP